MGAIDPVGITNASASNVRNKKARINAITTDSAVSRQFSSRTGGTPEGLLPEGLVPAGLLPDEVPPPDFDSPGIDPEGFAAGEVVAVPGKGAGVPPEVVSRGGLAGMEKGSVLGEKSLDVQ